jgi:hypothetical protein
MRKILITIIAIILIFLIFFAVDYKRAREDLLPLFAIKINTKNDGGNAVYYGFGYKVIKYTGINNDEIKVDFGPWSMEYYNPFSQTKISSFYGTIIDVSSDSIIVEPSEGEQIRNSSDKISIALSDTSNAKIGSKVFIKYTGEVMESYPAQINLISIEFIYNYSLATKQLKQGYIRIISLFQRRTL